MLPGKAFLGAEVGIIKRVEQISGDPSTDYPKYLTTDDINPVWDLSRSFEVKTHASFIPAVPPNAGTYSTLINGTEFLETVNDARGIRVEEASLLLEGKTAAQWAPENRVWIRYRSGTDFFDYLLANQFFQIGNNDIVPVVWTLKTTMFIGQQWWDQQNGIYRRVDEIAGFKADSTLQIAGGTGSLNEFTIGISLIY